LGEDDFMTQGELKALLASERIVVVPPADWPDLSAIFAEVERHDTGFAGALILLQFEDGLAALEQPSADRWVVRRLGDRPEADRFIQDRLAQYERMWDGCGCRIDYYS
jgi:hypothetical protein